MKKVETMKHLKCNVVAGRLVTFLSKDIDHLQPLSQLPRLETHIEQVNFPLAGQILPRASCAPVDDNQLSFFPQDVI